VIIPLPKEPPTKLERFARGLFAPSIRLVQKYAPSMVRLEWEYPRLDRFIRAMRVKGYTEDQVKEGVRLLIDRTAEKIAKRKGLEVEQVRPVLEEVLKRPTGAERLGREAFRFGLLSAAAVPTGGMSLPLAAATEGALFAGLETLGKVALGEKVTPKGMAESFAFGAVFPPILRGAGRLWRAIRGVRRPPVTAAEQIETLAKRLEEVGEKFTKRIETPEDYDEFLSAITEVFPTEAPERAMAEVMDVARLFPPPRVLAEEAPERVLEELEVITGGIPRAPVERTVGELVPVRPPALPKPALVTPPPGKPYAGLKPGTAEWMRVWREHPELQREMLEYRKKVAEKVLKPPTKKVVSKPTVKVGKEPWEMTREEWERSSFRYFTGRPEEIQAAPLEIRPMPTKDRIVMGRRMPGRVIELWEEGRPKEEVAFTYMHEVGHELFTPKHLGQSKIEEWKKIVREEFEKLPKIAQEQGGRWVISNKPEEDFADIYAMWFSKPKEGVLWVEDLPQSMKAFFRKLFGEPGPRDPHKEIVKWALEEGKPVPPEVLKDYPDLAKMALPRPKTAPPEVPREPKVEVPKVGEKGPKEVPKPPVKEIPKPVEAVSEAGWQPVESYSRLKPGDYIRVHYRGKVYEGRIAGKPKRMRSGAVMVPLEGGNRKWAPWTPKAKYERKVEEVREMVREVPKPPVEKTPTSSAIATSLKDYEVRELKKIVKDIRPYKPAKTSVVKFGNFPPHGIPKLPDGSISNGHWLLKPEYIPKNLQKRIETVKGWGMKFVEPPKTKGMEDFLPKGEELKPFTPIGEFATEADIPVVVLIRDDAKALVLVNKDYYDYLAKHIPKFRLLGGTDPEEALVIASGDDIAGVIMPMKLLPKVITGGRERIAMEVLLEWLKQKGK